MCVLKLLPCLKVRLAPNYNWTLEFKRTVICVQNNVKLCRINVSPFQTLRVDGIRDAPSRATLWVVFYSKTTVSDGLVYRQVWLLHRRLQDVCSSFTPRTEPTLCRLLDNHTKINALVTVLQALLPLFSLPSPFGTPEFTRRVH